MGSTGNSTKQNLVLAAGVLLCAALAFLTAKMFPRSAGDSTLESSSVVVEALRHEVPPGADGRSATSNPVAGGIPSGGLPPADPEAADPARVARAMDQSNIRSLIVRLKEGVATRNAPKREAARTGILRYGELARPLLIENIRAAESVDIRLALEDVLNAATVAARGGKK
jgi:hypothetical protein